MRSQQRQDALPEGATGAACAWLGCRVWRLLGRSLWCLVRLWRSLWCQVWRTLWRLSHLCAECVYGMPDAFHGMDETL